MQMAGKTPTAAMDLESSGRKAMGRKETIDILRHFKHERANEYGILDIGVFGSIARDDAGEDSDVDCRIPRILRLASHMF